MSWDRNRVRIELCDVMALEQKAGGLGMAAKSGAEIWLSDEEGKLTRRRKPDITLVGADRRAVLGQLAGWLEAHPGDEGLSEMAAEIAAKRQAASALEQAGAAAELEL
jgi:hypothetical protein